MIFRPNDIFIFTSLNLILAFAIAGLDAVKFGLVEKVRPFDLTFSGGQVKMRSLGLESD
jgi:hypothetical protein